MATDDSGPNPIKEAPLKEYVKQYSDMNAGSDAVDEIEAELLYLAEIIWREASERASERGLKTVQKQDVQGAYDDIFEPHKLLNEAQEQVEEIEEDLEDVANRSPIYKNWDSNDE